ncbi:MAG: SGNH/GDSL hydrolase family protein [Chloroflexi bacterium]|nr:SGNH/GDSL hydrolase family protein [Chloroflexota bacterium]
MNMRRLALALALLAAVAIAACGGSPSEARYDGLYLSLGDSVAAGNGASDPASTGFAALVTKDAGSIEIANLAVAGATTRDVIEKQLPRAGGAANGRKLAFITVSVGGNDLAALIPNTGCQQDPLPASCPLDAALSQAEADLDELMKQLRAAYPKTPVVLLLYPNFFSGTGHPFEAPAERVLPRLDDVIARVAARYQHTAVAAAAPAFAGRGGTLTHVLDPAFDPHPNDAGHRLIADAFLAALKRVK